MSEKVRKEAQVAAKWWADCFRNGPKFDNGDESSTGGLTMMMAKMLHQDPEPSSIDRFETILEKAIDDSLTEFGHVLLEVDYGPDLTLRDAAKKANLPTNCEFPWKTYMHVDKGSVKVSYGYGAPYEQLMT